MRVGVAVGRDAAGGVERTGDGPLVLAPVGVEAGGGQRQLGLGALLRQPLAGVREAVGVDHRHEDDADLGEQLGDPVLLAVGGEQVVAEHDRVFRGRPLAGVVDPVDEEGRTAVGGGLDHVVGDLEGEHVATLEGLLGQLDHAGPLGVLGREHLHVGVVVADLAVTRGPLTGLQRQAGGAAGRGAGRLGGGDLVVDAECVETGAVARPEQQLHRAVREQPVGVVEGEESPGLREGAWADPGEDGPVGLDRRRGGRAEGLRRQRAGAEEQAGVGRAAQEGAAVEGGQVHGARSDDGGVSTCFAVHPPRSCPGRQVSVHS